MVLVSDKPSNDIGMLQTNRRHRARHADRRRGLETMPLDQDIAGGPGAGEPRLTRGPAPLPHWLAVAHDGPPREPGLHAPTVRPRAARPPCEVGRFPLR